MSVLCIKLSNIKTTKALTEVMETAEKTDTLIVYFSPLRLQSPLRSCENIGDVLLPEIGCSAADFLKFASQIRVQLFLCVGLWAGVFLGSDV